MSEQQVSVIVEAGHCQQVLNFRQLGQYAAEERTFNMPGGVGVKVSVAWPKKPEQPVREYGAGTTWSGPRRYRWNLAARRLEDWDAFLGRWQPYGYDLGYQRPDFIRFAADLKEATEKWEASK